jgi:ABC-type Zn uptake system ZnuABC Zn-binding protein ZnuA
MRTLFPLFAAAVLAAGCASQDSESGETAAQAQSPPATETLPAEAVVAEAVVAEAAVATVTGTMGCGHCTYKTTTSCAAALQTDDGVVWILEGVAEDSELFTGRYDLGTVAVTGTKRAEEGTQYLAVQSYEPVTAAGEVGAEG